MDSNKGLKLLYNTIAGRFLLKIATSHFVAKIYAKYMNSKLSKYKIKKYIKKYNINISDYEKKNYSSFNDFFTRKIKPQKRKIEEGLISVCDAKLSAFKITGKSYFEIKNSIYTIDELLKEKTKDYEYALVFRLSVDDYHHYIFPDDGRIIRSKYIKGILHTVQPIAFKKYKVFLENTRNITFMECLNLGKVCFIEVGAMLIGKIVNEKVKKFKKGDEKGHFEFGGSTIVLLTEKNKVKINKNILNNTKNGIETAVKLGEKIGDFNNEK